jgi:LmbE family N-acetylglucosaminyl deacetylase
MTETLKLMFILAHPDDESLGMGGAAAKYAGEGVETYLVTATRGERGWFGDPAEYPGPATLGRIREIELRAAAATLGLRAVTFLDYLDGDLDQADPAEAISRIVAELRRVRPQVVVTFDPWGFYGHPDHIAISQLASAAVVAAANPLYLEAPGMAHQVSKLYYRAFTQAEQEAYEAAFGDLVMNVDGVERRSTTWPEWSLTTRIDTLAYWSQVWEAVTCHRTQLPGYQALRELPDEYHQQLWGTQTYYRAFSLVNGGRTFEDDLFAGVRESIRDHLLRLPVHIH